MREDLLSVRSSAPMLLDERVCSFEGLIPLLLEVLAVQLAVQQAVQLCSWLYSWLHSFPRIENVISHKMDKVIIHATQIELD